MIARFLRRTRSPIPPPAHMRALVYAEMIRVARAGETVTYGTLAALVGLNIHSRGDRRTLVHLIAAICHEEHAAGRPMLCTVVVRADTGRPGKGFFTVARALGREVGLDEATFLRSELARTHAYWSAAVL